ncbi:fructosyl amino acid oxidase [Aureobasidium pullulans]|nr:fructosyl amino acid oxidase [Aureobasidium pullulans]
MDNKESIVIVGAGVFGLSTALELSRRGYTDITVLDRHTPPVPDGSSVDISRIIRPDYADKFYARMGIEALHGWQKDFPQYFYRSGLLCAQSGREFNNEYLKDARDNLEKLGDGLNLWTFIGEEANVRYPSIHGDLSQTSGYCNLDAGWANAADSINHLANLCKDAGVKFLSGEQGTVTELVSEKSTDRKTISGVRTADGKVVNADTPVGYMQLTPEEAAEMHGSPVMINLSTGWFAFPPTPGDHLLKMARHGYGFETTHASEKSRYSAPSLSSQHDYLPRDAEQALRDGLALFLPKFKDRAFSKAKLCWYTDTPKGDFIVDYHPEYTNLFVATGGSGHAFKFLPILGRYVADNFEGTASEEQRKKWAWSETAEPIMPGDGSRGGPERRVLTEEEQARLF